LSQLKGKRVYVTPATRDFFERILAASGVKPNDIKRSPVVGVQAAANSLLSGEVDAVMLPPIDLYAPSIQALLRDPAVHLMNVAQAEALTRLFPSLNRLVLPQLRKELHPELIYLLAQTLKEVHSGAGIFQRAGEFPTINDPEFPVAEEALDYYKNGPSFLQRYLPFWMINYAKRVAAIVVTTIAIVIPLFTLTPKLYAWLLNLRLARLYRRLRLVNARLKSELNAGQVAALQTDLENIDRAANLLPMRHSGLFFALLMHIDMTRTRLATRLVQLSG
jgi:hypothetical protein